MEPVGSKIHWPSAMLWLRSYFNSAVFLLSLAKQMELGMDPGNSLHVWNWVVFVIGKMVGAVIVSAIIRRREDLGKVDPAAA